MSGFLGGATWAASRQPASFRGVPFGILESNLRRGRQTTLHLYPYRDDPWPEDLGRSPRITSFRGFVLGDDADARIKKLIDAVEKPGPGPLVHPVLGSINASVVQFSASDDPAHGRMWSFEMSVVPYIARVYPVATADTKAATKGWFGQLGDSLKADFATVTSAINDVKTQVGGVVQQVQGYAAQAQGLIHDATSLAHLPASLIGNFGRFAGGSSGAGGGGGVTSVFTTFAQASGSVSGAFNSVNRIGTTLGSLAGKL